jgi:hypothetical protein
VLDVCLFSDTLWWSLANENAITLVGAHIRLSALLIKIHFGVRMEGAIKKLRLFKYSFLIIPSRRSNADGVHCSALLSKIIKFIKSCIENILLSIKTVNLYNFDDDMVVSARHQVLNGCL